MGGDGRVGVWNLCTSKRRGGGEVQKKKEINQKNAVAKKKRGISCFNPTFFSVSALFHPRRKKKKVGVVNLLVKIMIDEKGGET